MLYNLCIPKHNLASTNETLMVFGLKIYNSLPIEIKEISNIKYFSIRVKKMLIQICPYNLDDAHLGLSSLI